MGKYESTTNVGSYRLIFFNEHQKNNYDTVLEYMTEEYVEEDITGFILPNYSNLVATTDIPKFFIKSVRVTEISSSFKTPCIIV